MSTSWANSPATRRVMLGNRSRDTKPELALRRLLHARGLRYRVDARPAPPSRCRADVLFSRARVVVFVDGCYWHGCPEHGTLPRSNREYWAVKIDRNRERDGEYDEMLVAAGWRVLRFWEHDDPAAAADAVERAVRYGASSSEATASPRP